MEKKELRRSLLQQRRSMSVAEWQQKSEQICDHLKSTAIFQQAQTVLAYFSFRQEPDLRMLFSLPKTWGFPRCLAQTMIWHPWSSDCTLPLQTSRYGITEPHPDLPVLQPEIVDLILVPAIACDHRGYRLGYGGGFYDRMLSDPAWAGKPTIGIVFELARLAHLPAEPWDLPLQGICTEAGLFTSMLETNQIIV